MATVIDIKNSIRKAINQKDNEINFFFNKIEKVQYPYAFFYIPQFNIDGNINEDYWRKINLMCVIEYAKSENNSATELWSYQDILTEMFSNFDFYNTKVSALNQTFKIVEDVLQMTFDLEFYVRKQDLRELMQEIEIAFKYVE